MRLIDADALIKQIEKNICEPCKKRKEDYNGVRCRACQYGDEMDDIEDAPTIEERKNGRWILNENQRKEDVACGNYLYICSKCGKSDIHAKTQEVPFCWWCGADMRGTT